LRRTLLTIALLFLLLLPVTQCTSILVQAQSKPTWAKEGVYLVYGWALWEFVPLEEVDSTIERLSQHGQDLFPIYLNLTEADDDKGVFRVSMGNETRTFEFYWGNASWNLQDFLPIYYPPEKLKGFPLVNVTTFLDTYEVYKVSNETMYGSSIFYYHKDTGVLLLSVYLSNIMSDPDSGKPSRDLIVMPLVDTNVPSTMPIKGTRASMTFSVVANTPETVNISSAAPASSLRTIEIITNDSFPSVQLNTAEYSENPTGIPPPSMVTPLSFIKIQINVPSDALTHVTIKFGVAKSSSVSLDPSTVQFYRLTTAWEALSTTRTGQDADYYYYEAVFPGLSYFAIAAKPLATNTTYIVAAVVVVIVIIIAALLFRRKQRRSNPSFPFHPT